MHEIHMKNLGLYWAKKLRARIQIDDFHKTLLFLIFKSRDLISERYVDKHVQR